MNGLLEHIIALFAILIVLAFKWQSIPPGVSPDCRYYLAMAKGERVPRPYAYRALIPSIARLCGGSSAAFAYIALVGTAACPILTYFVALKLGAAPVVAAAAALVFIGTEPLIPCWFRLPFLVDSWSIAFALGAFLAPDPFTCGLLLTFAAASKESGWAIGSAFVIGSQWTLWPVAIPGLVLLVVLRQMCRYAPPDRPHLQHPLRNALQSKRPVWFDYGRTLSGMKATPWLAAAVLPYLAHPIPCFLVIGIAAAQTLVATDHGRLIAMSVPFIVPFIAIALPAWLLWPWVLSTLFWPFKAEWI